MNAAEAKATWIELGRDIEILVAKSNAATDDESQFWRRMFCRALFGWLEAWLSFIRGDYLPSREAEGVFPKDPEKAEYFKSLFAATEPYEWILNDKGEGEQRPRKIGFRPYVKACIRMMYLLHDKTDTDADALFGSARWDALVRSVKCRDGLMHPHRAEDIHVSSEATDDFRVAIQLVTEMVHFTRQHLIAETERLQKRTTEMLAHSELLKTNSVMLQQLHSEIVNKKQVVHAVVCKVGDTISGYLVKKHPSNEGSAIRQAVDVVEMETLGGFVFVLRTPDAPQLEAANTERCAC